MTFFGLPPFFPFARAAATFAADVTLPPFRPSATAWGFLLTRQLRNAGAKVRDLPRVIGQRLTGSQMVTAAGAALTAPCFGGDFFVLMANGGGERVTQGKRNLQPTDSVRVRRHTERINPSGLDVNKKVRAA